MHSKIICFSKWANPGLFFVNFGLFKQTIKFLHHNQCEKMSCPSSIWRRASNPRPLEHEPSPARLALYVCSFQTFVIIDIIDKKVWLSLGIEPGAAAMPLRFDCQRSFYGLVYKQQIIVEGWTSNTGNVLTQGKLMQKKISHPYVYGPKQA